MGYQASNIKYGMMGWTLDDAVLATKRYDVNTAPDYRLESGTAAPATMPTTGAPAFSLLLSGLALVGAGLALHRRAA